LACPTSPLVDRTRCPGPDGPGARRCSTKTPEPLRGAFIAILAAAIAALGTLAGNQLAASNARDQLSVQLSYDDRVRQHEALRDAYTNFISATSQAKLDALRVLQVDIELQRNTTATELKELHADAAQLEALWADILMIGSRKAAGFASAVTKAYDALVLTPNQSAEELHKGTLALQPKLDAFVSNARAELK
jgi:hypothetical protein